MDVRRDIYFGSFHALLRRFEKSQTPYASPLSYLPPVDCDLNVIALRLVSAPSVKPDTLKGGTLERKNLEFKEEFQGQSELLYVHAHLIATLRRRYPPPDALELFLRIWKEKGVWLAKELNIRWRISAATTFADCGVTMEQRALGMGLSILFDSIKLHESERRITGQSTDMPFAMKANNALPNIAFDMEPYAIVGGDLDKNMLARLWALAESDAVIFPLARSMLSEIMVDKRTVFARIQGLKGKNVSDVDAENEDK